MRNRTIFLMLATVASGFCADWNPRLAADFLDGRQKEWFGWKRAASENGPCVSCHTGLPYLFARPALRGKLGEKEPTVWETGLMNRLRSHAGEKAPANIQGVECVFTALFLVREETKMSAEARKAFDQMWALQLGDEKQNGASQQKGSIKWYSAKLDPWENQPSFEWGSALAAMAVGSAPADYQAEPETRAHMKALTAFLMADFDSKPLHHRMGVLLAASKLPEIMTSGMRKALVTEILSKQSPDGGWTLEALGPWEVHEAARALPGSSAYATGYTAWVLQTAGVGTDTPAMLKALEWLKVNQDRETGAWAGVSMNKVYPEGSMESRFMQEAATAYASLALCGDSAAKPRAEATLK